MFNAAEEGKTLRTTMKGGTGNGLEIMLDIQQDEYLPVWGETEETAFEAGVRVQIHSHAEPPFVHELGFGVAPGFQTFVATQEQRVSDGQSVCILSYCGNVGLYLHLCLTHPFFYSSPSHFKTGVAVRPVSSALTVNLKCLAFITFHWVQQIELCTQ
ncbi:hypothetical protein SRHO_G00196200 [Serrasalmus rhombeus]